MRIRRLYRWLLPVVILTLLVSAAPTLGWSTPPGPGLIGRNASANAGTNDMYAYAYNNGYRTAFVNLGDSDGTGQDMWTNGSILADQLAAITQ